MKILMTSETYLPRHGGAEIHVKNLISRLRENGHKVVLFTNEIDTGEEIDRSIIRLAWSKKSLIKILGILWEESTDVDLIHAHYSYRLAALSAIIGKVRRIPVIITLHGMGILNHPNTPFIYQMAHSAYRYISLKLSTHVISTSEDLAKVAYKYIKKEKINVISNGFDENIFHKDIEVSKDLVSKYKGKKIILTVRRLVPKNGIHYLVEAMPYIIKKVPNAFFVMVGDGRMRDYIEKRIRELHLDKHIEVLGEVPNETVPQYLKVADTVVFPSTAESSSIACAEAMATGTFVVASRVGGLIELLGEKGERGSLVSLVPWEKSNYDAPLALDTLRYQALAEAVVEGLCGDTSGKVEAALVYSHTHLSWKVVAEKTLNVYKTFTHGQ